MDRSVKKHALVFFQFQRPVKHWCQEALDPSDQRTAMKTLRAVFLTHLHSDHVIDYPNILLYGWYAGIEAAASPFRGEMEPMFAPPGRQAVEPQVMNPSNPTPGTADMTGYLFQAFATDINDRMRDSGKKHPDIDRGGRHQAAGNCGIQVAERHAGTGDAAVQDL
jgi:ribonuclease BN (tRNA processing enzyme)